VLRGLPPGGARVLARGELESLYTQCGLRSGGGPPDGGGGIPGILAVPLAAGAGVGVELVSAGACAQDGQQAQAALLAACVEVLAHPRV
jgi:hypothetical protein